MPPYSIYLYAAHVDKYMCVGWQIATDTFDQERVKTAKHYVFRMRTLLTSPSKYFSVFVLLKCQSYIPQLYKYKNNNLIANKPRLFTTFAFYFYQVFFVSQNISEHSL